MVLPAPNLDDRRFQELVDEAKRFVMRRCPEWTDHNVSDPGVTLIETFAYMTDQMLYRLNRVPDRLYVKFLELIGLRLFPPAAARVPVTFWLSAAAGSDLLIPAGTQVSTQRTETREAVVFATLDDLVLVGARLTGLRTRSADGRESVDRSDHIEQAGAFPAFGATPEPGDILYLGLSDPVPGCVVSVDVECHTEGVGVDPRRPPLVWQAWDGGEWVDCEIERDDTGGLNTSGAVVLHVPATHSASVLDTERAGWLRALVTAPDDGRPAYRASPMIDMVSAGVIGGTTQALHAEVHTDDELGESEGVPGQRFTAALSPVLLGAVQPVLEVAEPDGWVEWTPVSDFGSSGPDDRHYVLDGHDGTVRFGPAVREADGSLVVRGRTPQAGAMVLLRRYAVGGGRAGNVAAGAINALRSSIPFVAAVENRKPAGGGVDGESLEEAKDRGPLLLRTRSRAVTAEDYEAITREIAPELSRVRCLTAGEEDVHAGSVKVLVVPSAAEEAGRLSLESLIPSEDVLARIASRLDDVRLIGTRVLVEPPLYRGVTVVAQVAARRGADTSKVKDGAVAALYQFLNPLHGGPDGTGWPFGRHVHSGDLFAVLQQVPGVDLVHEVRLFGANPITGDRGPQTTRLELEHNSLIFSFEHHVRVDGG